MNDFELDELLDKWVTPGVPASLRLKVKSRLRSESRQRPRWTEIVRRTLTGAALAGSAAALLLVTRAFPLNSPPVRLPFTVDSEFVTYDEVGVSTVELDTRSYAVNGQEFVLSRWVPGDPLSTALWEAGDTIKSAVRKLTLPFLVSPQMLEKAREARQRSVGFSLGRGGYFFAKSRQQDAACADQPVIGEETILGYSTVSIRAPVIFPKRMTLWLAPDLACFALKVTVEEPRPDGSFRLQSRKQALRVTRNP